MEEETSYVFPSSRMLSASWLSICCAGGTMPMSWLAEAGRVVVVVPVPAVPSLVPGRLPVGRGWRGAALGRTSCLEPYGKGKSRCHLPSDQETQVSFPSARAGAWEAASRGAGGGSSIQMWHQRAVRAGGRGGMESPRPPQHGLACCLRCPPLLCVGAGSSQPVCAPCPAVGTGSAVRALP